MLDENHVNYQEIDISKDREGLEEMVNKTNQFGVPVIDIDGEIVVGFDKEWIMKKLGLSG